VQGVPEALAAPIRSVRPAPLGEGVRRMREVLPLKLAKVRAHALLETEGLHYRQSKYERAAGFDTLCDHANSRLFTENGWGRQGRR